MNHELAAFLNLTPGNKTDLTLAGEPHRDDRNELYTGTDGQEHWGFHLMIDCSGCNPKIDDIDQIKQFIKSLVTAIKMTAVGEPLTYNFGTGADGGWSALQLITTSSITLHGDNRVGSMYFDVFSCKPFDVKTALKLIKQTFSPKYVNVRFLYRDAPHDNLLGLPNALTVE